MHRLEDLDAFVAIAEEGSLTAAARRLRRSLQSISRSLATLERSIGIELIRRTTRQSSLTAAGLNFYNRVRPALLEISDAGTEAANQRAEPAGLLRITASVVFAPIYLVPVIARFMQRYPKIEIELKLSDRFVDLVDEGIDLAIRIGNLPDSGLRAKRLGEVRRVVFGSPTYFAKHGRPAHPEDLVHHQCITRRLDTSAEMWPFLIDREMKTVRVTGRLRTDSTAATYAAAALGLGLGFTPLWQIRHLVDQGELDVVLADFETPKVPVHAVSPSTKIPLPKAQLFTEFLQRRLKSERL